MKRVSVVVVLLLFSTTARAQIVFTSEDYLNFVATVNDKVTWLSSDTGGARMLESTKGASKMWDFTALAFHRDSTTAFGSYVMPYPGSAPLANDPDFVTATHVEVDTLKPGYYRYNFYRIDPSGFWTLGTSEDSMGQFHKYDVYSPPALQMKFPLAYDTSWQMSSTYLDLKYDDTVHVRSNAIVDGYGAIVFPGQSPTEALRVSIHTRTIDQGDTSGGYTFMWLTKTPRWAVANTDDSLKPTYFVTYYAPASDAVRTEAQTNGKLDLRITCSHNIVACSYQLPTESRVHLEIYDILGNAIRSIDERSQSAGEQYLSMDAGGLAAGFYTIRLASDAGTAIAKFCVMR